MSKTILSLFLIVNLLYLSMEAWSSSTLLAEMNEEVENVVEKSETNDVENAVYLVDCEFTEFTLRSSYDLSSSYMPVSADYFEIDSPPPDLV